jgi:hypothetical protein
MLDRKNKAFIRSIKLYDTPKELKLIKLKQSKKHIVFNR